MSLQYGAEETPLAGSYGAADSFPKDFGYGVEEEEEEAAAAGGGVGAGAGGGCGPGGADSSKPRILLMGLRRSGKSSIQKVSGAAPGPPAPLPLAGARVATGHGGGAEEGGGSGWPAGLSHRAISSPLGSGARGAARGGPRLGVHAQVSRGGVSLKARLAGGRQVPVAPPGTSAPWDPTPESFPKLRRTLQFQLG